MSEEQKRPEPQGIPVMLKHGRPMVDKRLQKHYDDNGNYTHTTVNFTTGPIPNHPGYVTRKDGSVFNTAPRVLNKKERHRDTRSQIEHEGGYRFICNCRAITFHFPSKIKVEVKGYEKKQVMETYECCLCGHHFLRSWVDDAIAKHAAKQKEDIDGSRHDHVRE